MLWGDLTVEQYRIDTDNALTLVSSKVIRNKDRKGGDVKLSGVWAHSPADPSADPLGVAQGVDLIVVKMNGDNRHQYINSIELMY